MATEANKATMQRFLEFINTANKELAAELIAPEAVFHVPGRAEPMKGPAGYLCNHRYDAGRIGYPLDTPGLMAESRCGGRALHRADRADGAAWRAAYRHRIEVQAMNFYRLSGGQFVEERGQPDIFGLLQQIGAVHV